MKFISSAAADRIHDRRKVYPSTTLRMTFWFDQDIKNVISIVYFCLKFNTRTDKKTINKIKNRYLIDTKLN